MKTIRILMSLCILISVVSINAYSDVFNTEKEYNKELSIIRENLNKTVDETMSEYPKDVRDKIKNDKAVIDLAIATANLKKAEEYIKEHNINDEIAEKLNRAVLDDDVIVVNKAGVLYVLIPKGWMCINLSDEISSMSK